MNNKIYTFLIKSIHFAINMIFILILLIILIYGIYSIWDHNRIYKYADNEYFSQYKPTKEDTSSFEKLKSMNNDVIGWITIYDTCIDYPLVQSENNEKYLKTDVFGEYALSGSIFLDYRNKNDFSDFNSIIYGHNMEKNKMFGDVNLFSDKNYFDNHKYGRLYTNGKEYGIELFSFVEVDAYNDKLYIPNIKDDYKGYLEYIIEKSKNYRDIGIDENDRIILLSTCTYDITNGRHLLIGKISDNMFENTIDKSNEVQKRNIMFNKEKGKTIPIYIIIIIVITVILIVLFIIFIIHLILKKKKTD